MEKIRHLTLITKLELGGAQQVALHTAEHLPEAWFEKHLIAGAGGLLDTSAQSLPGVETRLWKSFKHPIRPWFDLWTVWRLARFMRTHRIQIVHTHSSKAGLLGRLAARWARVPAVFHTVHGWPFHERQNALARWMYVLLERLAARWTTVLIAVSQATLEKGLKHGIGTREQYTVIFPGSDLSQFKPGTEQIRRALRREFGFSPAVPLVGMVANFKPQKAPLDFIQAASRIHQAKPEVGFLLVGDGPLRSSIEAAVADLGLKQSVALAGWRKDIPRIMRSLDIAALSSLWEGLPCVFAQAMACGVPVVATRVEGAPEAIQEGRTGLLVPPGRPAALAQAVLELLQKPALRKKMGILARRDAGKFSFSRMQENILKLYQKHIQISRKKDKKQIKSA